MEIVRKKGANMILDTDWWTDCDDCVALRILAWAHKKGYINLIGISMSACMEHSVKSLDAFLSDSGVTGVLISIDRDATDFGKTPKYQARMAMSGKNTRYNSNDEAQDPVKMYRKLLSESEEKIELVAIGYPQILSALLDSKADEFSNLDGINLVKEKVSKMWMMAGYWEKDKWGSENNFARNERSIKASYNVVNNWPTPITFLGWEASHSVMTGKTLKDGDMLKDAFIDYGCAEKGRSSFDPMLVLMAIIGDEEKAGYDIVRGHAKINPDTGENIMAEDANGSHAYVVKKFDDSFYAQAIDKIINE